MRIKPDAAAAHYMLANAYIQKDMQGKAIAEYKKATEIASNYMPACRALAEIYSK